VYVHPPTASEVDQGVILDSVFFYGLQTDCAALVLTPTCDFAQQKAEFIQLCAARTASEFFGAIAKRANEFLEQLMTQRFPRYHWLVPLPGTTVPLILDFQSVQSVPWEFLEQARIVGQLVSPYREQVPARYAAYMGRVGTPDHSPTDLAQWIAEAKKIPTPK
jgi:hypothetical protein